MKRIGGIRKRWMVNSISVVLFVVLLAVTGVGIIIDDATSCGLDCSACSYETSGPLHGADYYFYEQRQSNRRCDQQNPFKHRDSSCLSRVKRPLRSKKSFQASEKIPHIIEI